MTELAIDVVARGAEVNQYVTFTLGPVEYALPILQVQEFKGYCPLTPIPNMPDYVRGVMNLRGVIIPVYDLRLRLGLPSQIDVTSVIVVAVVERRTVGLVVDAVSDVIEIAPGDIQDVNEMTGRSSNSSIRGVAKAQDRMVVLLNLGQLVSIDDIAAATAG